jgi:hypothetical protein
VNEVDSLIIHKWGNTSCFEGMPTRLPLLQSYSKTLSKSICSTSRKDNFMETPSNFAKIFFIPTASQVALRKPSRALKECQKGCHLYKKHSNFIENKK